MTDDEAMALGLRAVACKGFRWMGGMMDMQGRTVTPCILFRAHPSDVPDFRDPATMGCLVHLVRAAHGRRCYTQAVGGYWTVQNDDTEDAWGDHCVDEAEALVVALEAAPA